MSNKQQGKRSDTSPGLGPGALAPASVRNLSELAGSRVTPSPLGPGSNATPPGTPSVVPPRRRLRDSIRREDVEDEGPNSEAAPAPSSFGSRPAAAFHGESPTGTRPKGSRDAVTVDQVGAAAIRMAKEARLDQVPRVVASRELISMAPIDARAAFIMALVDGRNTVEAIVDMSGMASDEARAVLEKLALLRLIEFR